MDNQWHHFENKGDKPHNSNLQDFCNAYKFPLIISKFLLDQFYDFWNTVEPWDTVAVGYVFPAPH